AAWLSQPVLGSPEDPEKISLDVAQTEAREKNRQIEMASRSITMAKAGVDLLEGELEDLREERDELEEIELRVDLEIPLDELFEGLGLEELLKELGLAGEVDLEDEVITIPIDIESEELEDFTDTGEMDDAIKELETEKDKAERKVKMARLGYDEAIEEVKFGVLELFTGIIIMDKQLSIQEETLQRMEERFRLELHKYYAGNASELEIEEMRSQLRELEIGIEMMKNSREQTVERFADFIGRTPDSDLQTVPYKPQQPESINFAILLSEELNTNYAVKRAELEIENARDDRDLAGELHGTDSPQYIIAEEELEVARLELEDQRMNARSELLSDYHEVLEAEQELSNRQDDVELAEKEHEVARVSYNQGLINNIEFALSRLELMEAEMEFEQARFKYHTALAGLKAVLER
ncbi:MAG: TolC family protein, partial [Bacillota bacterium]